MYERPIPGGSSGTDEVIMVERAFGMSIMQHRHLPKKSASKEDDTT
jgi:hypothetical protein